MADQRVMQDISLNEPISVEAPAYVWLGLMAAYNTVDWSDQNMNAILSKVQHAIMDPIWIREREAAMQEQADQHNALFHNFLAAHLPEQEERPGDDQL